MFKNVGKAVKIHDSALEMPFEELEKVANALSRGDPFAVVRGPSHHVISFNNVSTLQSEELQIEFGEKISKQLWAESRVKARSMIFLPFLKRGSLRVHFLSLWFATAGTPCPSPTASIVTQSMYLWADRPLLTLPLSLTSTVISPVHNEHMAIGTKHAPYDIFSVAFTIAPRRTGTMYQCQLMP